MYLSEKGIFNREKQLHFLVGNRLNGENWKVCIKYQNAARPEYGFAVDFDLLLKYQNHLLRRLFWEDVTAIDQVLPPEHLNVLTLLLFATCYMNIKGIVKR